MLVRFSDFIDLAALRENPDIKVTEDLTVEREVTELPRINGIHFTATQMFAGFVDTYNRMEVLYNLIDQVNDVPFRFPVYHNPHCRELDFFDIFGMSQLNEPVEGIPETSFEINVNEFLYYLFFEPEFFDPSVQYEIRLDNFYFYVASRNLYHHLELDRRILLSRISFTPDRDTKDLFSEQANKIVLHLRRGDTLGKIVDPEAQYGSVTKGMSTFPVMTLKHVPAILKDLQLDGPIEVILVSDGISSRELNRFLDDERVTAAFAELSREMVEDEIDMAEVKIIKRVIGREPHLTHQTMTHIYEADYVIAQGSSFAVLPATLGGTKFVFARKYLEVG